MSSRLGTGALEELDELVEEAQRVVGPRSGLWVVLHAARRHVEQADALDRPVVEVHVRELGGAELRLDPHADLALDRKAVVLRGDRDPARPQVLDGVVRATVPERELEGLEPRGAGEQLMAEADAEDGLRGEQLADRLHDVVERRRVAGTRDEEKAVGIAGEQLFGRGGAGVELERGATAREV